MRTRILGTAVIKEGRAGGTIQWAIEAHGSALALFSASERNAIVREALVDGGKFYIAVFVPKNFTDYAVRKGYDVSAKYETRKRKLIERGTFPGPELPLVWAGVLREAALTRSTAQGTATANKATVLIRIPIPPHGPGGKGGYGIAKIVGAVLRTIMPWEVERVAEVVTDSILRGLQGRLEQRFSNPAPPPARKPVQGQRRARPVTGKERAHG